MAENWWDTKGRQPTLACDLDGTIFKKVSFPEFGEPIPGMIQELRRLWKDGWKIIIWTCRTRDEALLEHLTRFNVPYNEINTNSDGPHDSPKIHADVYLDDKAYCFDGRTEGLAKRIKAFRPWHEKEEEPGGHG
jgi:hypothetical protein